MSVCFLWRWDKGVSFLETRPQWKEHPVIILKQTVQTIWKENLAPTWMWSAGCPGTWGCQMSVGEEELKVWEGATVRGTKRWMSEKFAKDPYERKSQLWTTISKEPYHQITSESLGKNLPFTFTSLHPSLSATSQGAIHFSCQIIEDAQTEQAELPSPFHCAGFGLKRGWALIAHYR